MFSGTQLSNYWTKYGMVHQHQHMYECVCVCAGVCVCVCIILCVCLCVCVCMCVCVNKYMYTKRERADSGTTEMSPGFQGAASELKQRLGSSFDNARQVCEFDPFRSSSKECVVK